MYQIHKFLRPLAYFIAFSFMFMLLPPSAGAIENTSEEKKYIKYVEFHPTLPVLEQALEYDISTHGTDCPLNWLELLAYAAAKSGGVFEKRRSQTIDSLVKRLRAGEQMADITQDMQYYAYYLKAYHAILCNFLGEYRVEVYDESAPEQKRVEERYGLTCFSPIAAGYGFSHYEEFRQCSKLWLPARPFGQRFDGIDRHTDYCCRGGHCGSARLESVWRLAYWYPQL